MSNEQAVAKPDEVAQPTSETKGAQEDLDQILNEFEKGQTTETVTPAPKPPEDKVLAQKVEVLERTIAESSYRRDITDVVKNVRGNIDSNRFDDTEVEAWIDAQARKDKRIADAFANRNNNPTGWAKVVKGLGEKFQAKFDNLPSKDLTQEREHIASAVKGASSTKPQAQKSEDFNKMSDKEFNNVLKEVGLM